MSHPIRLTAALFGLACLAGALSGTGAMAQQTRPATPTQAQAQRPPQAPAQQAPGQAAQGQQPPAQGQPADANAAREANARASGWVTRCVSQGRKAPAECVIEQSLQLMRTNQVVTIVHLRIPAEGQQPALSVRVPHGVLLNAGARLRVDAGYTLDLPIQTCDQQGCYANAQAPAELLAALRTGRQLLVVVKSGNGQDLSFTMPTEGFGAAFDRVK